jgi:NAD(P)-dependent dehydrogenase (short-subunit alcohol dehydrogenase family)
MSRKVAFITGGSRGIGKWCALELAAEGYDVAITARTAADGERREQSNTLRASDISALPGSLENTASLIRKEGVTSCVVPADLLDPASLGAAVATVLARLGRIDVIVHCGRYTGPGHMDRFLDTPIMGYPRQPFNASLDSSMSNYVKRESAASMSTPDSHKPIKWLKDWRKTIRLSSE